jgi:hypothetical protein
MTKTTFKVQQILGARAESRTVAASCALPGSLEVGGGRQCASADGAPTRAK